MYYRFGRYEFSGWVRYATLIDGGCRVLVMGKKAHAHISLGAYPEVASRSKAIRGHEAQRGRQMDPIKPKQSLRNSFRDALECALQRL